MATYLELKAQAEELMRRAEEARIAEVKNAVAEIRAKMAEYRITLADLGGGGAKKTAGNRSSVAPKYRDPATGRTWSGRGMAPKWLAAYVAAGRKREEFLI